MEKKTKKYKEKRRIKQNNKKCEEIMSDDEFHNFSHNELVKSLI